MNQRKKELLTYIIEEYINKVCPVGSKFLAEKIKLKLSPATIRNEMVELEKEGYIFQPYTSAGRAPTEKGYQFYLENYLDEFTLESRDKKALDDIIKDNQKFKKDSKIFIKEIAKQIAEHANETVVIGFSRDEFYYTGLSNIFAKPEFNQQEKVVCLSGIIDHLDKTMEDIYNKIKQTQVFIGKDNPFGADCSLVITNLDSLSKEIFGILGPVRMNYKKNINYINYLKEKLI